MLAEGVLELVEDMTGSSEVFGRSEAEHEGVGPERGIEPPRFEIIP